MVRLLPLAVLLLAGCPQPVGDDDSALDDDDSVLVDDDDSSGADDDDSSSQPDDDDSVIDDDDSALDDDVSGVDDYDCVVEDDDSGEDDDSVTLPDLGSPGPWTVDVSTASTTAGTSCDLAYTLYEPQGAPAGAPVVVLGHGFLRGQAQMAGLGEHLASWGLRAATPALCHSSLIDSDPPLNGADMVALATELGAIDRMYAGHSAGGAAAVLAAGADPAALAVVGLDAVEDSEGEVTALAPGLATPVHGIFGEISGCNQDGSGIAPMGTAPTSTLVRVTEADHCDFEDPYDPLCSLLCSGTNDQFDDDAIRHTIRALLTAALLWRSGLEPAGELWWTTGGAPHDALLASGAIAAL